ncbi:conserved hypothetical protein [Frankia canadensis]|uniref:Uncharacterized protein n=1 Tax=Frankia canadensis TaxID=1836972 RepID=A0A2I2KRS8_9ACTN|nr:hypothetical protein [Frankia canadensis]SNQ48373.1 conserved hypothetical protein [Frankia canadensis]SOU55663.1 conserved hypothetical protein [Frankia canadensis]
MSLTTIKVESAVRDRLAAVARARGTTMAGLLDAESRRLEAEQHWAAIEESYARIQREDPDGWREYLDELDSWDAATAGTDSSASSEWPEFNR